MTGGRGGGRVRWTGALARWTPLALALALALARPAAAADLPAGDAALGYQVRTSRTDDPSVSRSSTTEQDLGLILSQELPNYGLLRAETHWFDPVDDGGERGWTQVVLDGLKLNGAEADVALGDSLVDARLLPRRLLILFDPIFELEGAVATLTMPSGGVSLFGGQAIDRVGSFASGLARFDQDVAGFSFRRRFGERVAVSGLALHTEGAGTLVGGRVPASSDSAGLGADLRLLEGLGLLGEVRYVDDPNAPGASARSSGLSYAVGPLLQRPGLRFEGTLFSLDPAYVPVQGVAQSADRRGLYTGASWDPSRNFGLFGSALRSRNNLAGDSAIATIETTQLVVGGRGFVPLRWPLTLVVRADTTRLESRSSPSPLGVRSTTTSLFGEVAQVIGAWRPLLRTRWSRLEDDALGVSSTTLDLTGEVWWQVTRRARLWAALQWTDLAGSAGLADSTRYVARAGGEQRVSAALFVRGEGEANRAEEVGFASTRLGVTGSLGYRHRFFDLYADLRRNWTEAGAGVPTRTEDTLYLRVTVPLRWGTSTPPPIGRAPGVETGGWGTIEGEVFVDADGDGRRGPAEVGLEGLRLVLDGLPGATATTDERGAYRFGRVATGAHSVRLEVRRLPADYDLATPQLVEATVGRRQTARIDFAVQPLGRVEGQVTSVVTTREGPGGPEPAGSVPLFLRRGDDIWQTFSDADGRFAFENVRGGEYEVLVDPAAVPDDGAVEPPARAVRLGVGEAVTGVDFTIRRPVRPEIRNGEQTRAPTPEPARPPAPTPPAEALLPAPAAPALPVPTLSAGAYRLPDRSRDCFGDSPEPGMIGFFRFETNSDELASMERSEAERWAAWLRGQASRRLFVEGHTDRRADDPYNFGLAARRALAVYRTLVRAGAPEDRLRLVPVGPDLPCDPADSPAAWASNRRALIIADPGE